MNKKLLALLLGLNVSVAAQAETPSLEQMWQLIQDQQNEIAQLKGQLEETDVKTEATISAVEQFSARPVASSKTTFGGYGEVHYNNLAKDDSSKTKDAVDFHRF